MLGRAVGVRAWERVEEESVRVVVVVEWKVAGRRASEKGGVVESDERERECVDVVFVDVVLVLVDLVVVVVWKSAREDV